MRIKKDVSIDQTGDKPVKSVMIVFGTRPEAIKMAPLILKMKEMPETFDVKVCVTGQHRQMLDQVLEIFNIVPDLDLDVMKPGQGLAEITSNVLSKMYDVITEYTPNIVLVHGDTTTTLATSLACFYAGVPVGHVEAGLRTYNMHSPFPEEFNRQAVSKISSLHFAPTQQCKENLLSEQVIPSSIHITGNTVIDALQIVTNRLNNDEQFRIPVRNKLAEVLDFSYDSEQFILITGHRRENFGDGFLQICEAISDLCLKYPKMHFVYPVHLNPNVQKPVRSLLERFDNIHLIEPLDYLTFSTLLQNCFFVLTDSGGLQEEAPSLGKPVLLMRDTTERPEAVEAGTVLLVGANRQGIVHGATRLIEDEAFYKSMATARNPFGYGDAVEKIIYPLKEFLEK
jgi:UDP-N-acetylglucosamine 2-epimerase (non-hydrolysing)